MNVHEVKNVLLLVQDEECMCKIFLKIFYLGPFLPSVDTDVIPVIFPSLFLHTLQKIKTSQREGLGRRVYNFSLRQSEGSSRLQEGVGQSPYLPR